MSAKQKSSISHIPSIASSPLKSTDGITRVIKALRYSMQGISHAFRFEAAFRQELLITIPAMIGLWFLPVTAVEKVVLFGSTLLVLIVELLNSAIEAVVDRVSTEHHPLSGRAKDLGSAAVCLAFLLMTAAWLAIALPPLLTVFQ